MMKLIILESLFCFTLSSEPYTWRYVYNYWNLNQNKQVDDHIRSFSFASLWQYLFVFHKYAFFLFLLRLKISRILYNKKEVEDVANISSGYNKFPTLVNTNHLGEVLGFLSNSKEKNKGVSF